MNAFKQSKGPKPWLNRTSKEEMVLMNAADVQLDSIGFDFNEWEDDLGRL